MTVPKPLRAIAIGGGAAGFFGAIAAARPHTRVTLLEAGRQVLAKVRISGGGRCNVTHACFDPARLVKHYPRGHKALLGPLNQFQPRDTVAWFQQRGVQLKTEADGRMFPVTDDSGTIVDCLVQSARRAGVEMRTGSPVVKVARRGTDTPLFDVHLQSGEVLECDRLLLATGSSPQGHRIARSLGHRIVPPVPSLFTFNIRDDRLQGLAGVSVPEVNLKLQMANKTKLEQSGPLLVTHWGVSGPAVLKLSAWGARALHDSHYRAQLSIHWLPQWNGEEVRQQLRALKLEAAKRAIASRPCFGLPKRLWQAIAIAAGIPADRRWADLSNKMLNRLAQALTQSQFEIRGKSNFKEEFVTCGGVELDRVDFKTMESRCCAGLYFAGEVLDIDGVTGGFNFQSAWTTSWIAGRAIGRSMRSR
ncbi:NAD(P)/FAD-dependent oxidoreductase [Synechococcus sp. PCC 7336]|uniref:NAD(P)/FAD-dependent oxidoreductase n=1 Tax=Synechococcus sp. PCC 7336 TaxID=195250 RepID=UPI0003478E2F|nr:NAD(P)/FAD-dependent oxidoreductase [Synechococcus sp. PCC 7336]